MARRTNRLSAYRWLACIVAAAGYASVASAQTALTPPSPGAPNVHAVGCNTVDKPLSAGGASIVPDQPGVNPNPVDLLGAQFLQRRPDEGFECGGVQRQLPGQQRNHA